MCRAGFIMPIAQVRKGSERRAGLTKVTELGMVPSCA